MSPPPVKGRSTSWVAAESDFYRAPPAEIERERRHIEEYIGIASYLGAPLLRVNTCPYGKALPAAIVPKGVTDEMAFAAAVRTFRSLMPLAEKHGITFVLENHGGISRTSADQIKITKAVGSKWFRLNLDTGNYHADPMAGTDPFEDFLEATPKLAPYLAFCHAKIWDVTDDLREPTLDDDRFFVLLRKFRYQGPISIEYMGKKDVTEMLPKCVALLKRCRSGQPPSPPATPSSSIARGKRMLFSKWMCWCRSASIRSISSYMAPNVGQASTKAGSFKPCSLATSVRHLPPPPQ